MPRPKKIQDGEPVTLQEPVSAEVEVVVMCDNIAWPEDVKHFKRDRFKMKREDAELICNRDRAAGRDERLMII